MTTCPPGHKSRILHSGEQKNVRMSANPNRNDVSRRKCPTKIEVFIYVMSKSIQKRELFLYWNVQYLIDHRSRSCICTCMICMICMIVYVMTFMLGWRKCDNLRQPRQSAGQRRSRASALAARPLCSWTLVNVVTAFSQHISAQLGKRKVSNECRQYWQMNANGVKRSRYVSSLSKKFFVSLLAVHLLRQFHAFANMLV